MASFFVKHLSTAKCKGCHRGDEKRRSVFQMCGAGELNGVSQCLVLMRTVQQIKNVF